MGAHAAPTLVARRMRARVRPRATDVADAQGVPLARFVPPRGHVCAHGAGVAESRAPAAALYTPPGALGARNRGSVHRLAIGAPIGAEHLRSHKLARG